MADDSPLIVVSNHDHHFLGLMHGLLVEEGYRVVVLQSASGMYQTVLRERPALVIIDTPIHELDEGWHLLVMLRLNPRTTALPILICSTNTQRMRDNAERLEAMGCKLLAKPFDIEEMLARIDELLSR